MKILGYRRKKKKDWISLDTWETIDKGREAKKKLQEAKSQCVIEQIQTKYSELDREVKKKERADNKAFTEKLADDAEEAAQKQDMDTLYKIIKSLAGGFKKSNDVPVKDSDGNATTGITE